MRSSGLHLIPTPKPNKNINKNVCYIMLMLYICVSSFVLYRHWDCDQLKGSSLEKGIRWNILKTSACVLHLWLTCRYLVQDHCTFFIHQAVNGCSKRQIGQRLEQIDSRQGFYTEVCHHIGIWHRTWFYVNIHTPYPPRI